MSATGAFRAFRSRNYRLFFVGQCVSLIGTWMQQVAVGWLVYRLTGSATWLGVMAFAAQAPTFFITPLAGAFADRWDRKRMFVTTQTLAMMQALLLAVVTLGGAVTVGRLVLLSLGLGLINAVDAPVRQSLVPDLVAAPADLPNAIALNSSLINGARLVGPALAGVLIASIGEGGVFLLNGASYLAVIAALLALQIPKRPTVRGSHGIFSEVVAGWRYVAGSVPIRSILLLLAAVSIASSPVSVLMPVVASQTLGGGPNTLGALSAANGCGALIAALLLARRPTIVGIGRWIVAGGVFMGTALIGFALSRHLALSVVLVLGCGWGLMTQMASCNTVVQAVADPAMRGRVMALYTLAFLGTMPFGSLIAGALANRIGTPPTLALGGVICLLASLAFGKRLPRIRRATRQTLAAQGRPLRGVAGHDEAG